MQLSERIVDLPPAAQHSAEHGLMLLKEKGQTLGHGTAASIF